MSTLRQEYQHVLPSGIAIEARSASPFTYRIRVLSPGGKPIGHPRNVTASTAFRAVVAFLESSKLGASASMTLPPGEEA